MPPLADPVVDWSAVLDVVWTSFVAGIGVTAAFAVGILGATRAGEQRRNGNGAVAGVYLGMMVLAMAVVVAAVVFGIVVMTTKT